MKQITFVIPSRNNLDLLKLCYKSIKDLGNDHHILVLNDASVDGTLDWLKEISKKKNYKVIIKNSTDQISNVSIQGPDSRKILNKIIS